GTDASGASSLTYTWTVTSAPSGAPAVGFSANGTNAAQNTTATFHAAGTYTFLATITDPANLTAPSSVSVTGSQTFTSVVVSPTSASIAELATQQFTASAKDQFGSTLSAQPAWTWTMTGIGTLTPAGLYTAPGSTGTATVKATSGSIFNTAAVT